MNIREIQGSAILIVDDNPANLGTLFDYLSKFDFTVLVAQSGEDALELVRENTPDIILLDILMPGMDGFETCLLLKADEKAKDIPVLFVSSLSETVDKVRGFEAGGIDYITKPFQQEEVLARVSTHLSLHKLRSELEEKNIRLQEEILERERAEKLLRKSEEKYRTLVEAADDSIVLSDMEFRHVYANMTYYTSLGYEKDSKVMLEWLSQIHPDDVPLVKKKRAELLKTGKTESEYRIRHQKGHWIYCSAKLVVIYDEGKKPEAILAIIRDISDRRQMEEELRQAKEAAESSNRSKSEFLANMSHEIRTPMNAILGFTELLEGQILDEHQRHYLSAIKAGGKTLLGLINDILDLSKIEAGKLKLEYSAVHLCSVFKETEQMFSHKISEKGLNFIIETDQNLPEAILFDEIRLRQIILNLVGNAVKFTESGYVKLYATHQYVNKDHKTSDIIFSVEDTGIGIPEDQRESIFGAFEQQHGQSHACFGGTVLGLAITKRLVEMMDGEIYVTGEIGKGSTFHVIFRNVAMPPVSKSEGKEKNRSDNDSVRFKKASILVADDVKFNRTLIKSYLLKHPEIRIIEAENGKEAADLAKCHQPDVILMDMKMPLTDGYEATQIIKSNEALRHIPIIAITAEAMKQDMEKITNICDAYIAKPLARDDLICTLIKFLKHSVEESGITDHEWLRLKPKTKSLPEATNSETLAKLPELLKTLESQVSVWEDLSEILTINDIEDFANEMKTLGIKYDYKPLAVWGDRLLLQATMFDIDSLSRTLKDFPDIIGKIKMKLENRDLKLETR